MSDRFVRRIRDARETIRNGRGKHLYIDARNHIKFRFVNRYGIPQLVVMSKTASDWRSERNFERELHRALTDRTGIRAFTPGAPMSEPLKLAL